MDKRSGQTTHQGENRQRPMIRHHNRPDQGADNSREKNIPTSARCTRPRRASCTNRHIPRIGTVVHSRRPPHGIHVWSIIHIRVTPMVVILLTRGNSPSTLGCTSLGLVIGSVNTFLLHSDNSAFELGKTRGASGSGWVDGSFD